MFLKSNSIQIFLNDLEDIYNTAINLSLYKHINPSLFKNPNININKEESKLYENLVKFNQKNHIYNYLTVNMVSIMESYLHNLLIEVIEKDSAKSIAFVEKYNFQKSITHKDVIDGPKTLAINTLNGIIYHNLSKVNIIYKIILDIDILKVEKTEIKNIFTIINIRHKVVHDSNRIDDKKFYIKEDTFFKFLSQISNWLLNIDSLVSNNSVKKRENQYTERFIKDILKYTKTPLLKQSNIHIMHDYFDKIDDELKNGKNNNEIEL